ncbi:MAG: hypothetical protein AB1758_14040 [Candidatus Eremiobacterota bacterium]
MLQLKGRPPNREPATTCERSASSRSRWEEGLELAIFNRKAFAPVVGGEWSWPVQYAALRVQNGGRSPPG